MVHKLVKETSGQDDFLCPNCPLAGLRVVKTETSTQEAQVKASALHEVHCSSSLTRLPRSYLCMGSRSQVSVSGEVEDVGDRAVVQVKFFMLAAVDLEGEYVCVCVKEVEVKFAHHFTG